MPRPAKPSPTAGKTHATQQSVDAAIWSICDVMRRGNVTSALQYVSELTWILFLRILDETEEREAEEAEAVGGRFAPSLTKPFRWRDWAAPGLVNKRDDLTAMGKGVMAFANAELIPHLKALKNKSNATSRQRIISQVLSSVEKVRIDTERNFLDVLDRVHGITTAGIDPTHVFALSQIYEGLLLKLGEKGSDAGAFFTPREVIRAMVRTVDPKLGETIYDPCCGTGGFLAQAYEHMKPKPGRKVSADQLEELKHRTFWGREKDTLSYPIGLANLVLHGIDRPNIWHGNALTGDEVYGGLFAGAPAQFDVILTNPPFGGKENKGAQTNFDYPTSATQVLFLQHFIRSLAKVGRAGVVIDEGVLFRTNEEAFVKTKRKLTDECDLWCIVSLPGGVFTAAGAGVKTNLLFFTKGRPTERIWYYDLSDVKVGKKTPLTLSAFEDFFARLPKREDSERSWTVDLSARREHAANQAKPWHETALAKQAESESLKQTLAELKKAKAREEDISACQDKLSACIKDGREAAAKAETIENAVYDLKAVNPNRKDAVDARTPDEIITTIEALGIKIVSILDVLKKNK